ncbi:MAG: hypothetical protein GAK35_02647 [Herbaspirillum frisingense]|uniref:Uncharacterized protein n=1 Tax=Herbaspirillum frisingense TaxID=92645 RepID=A0A7V8FVQ4_9BURK|nr:MAG: hypothetical protein GAK35_02647 [Herbaspirillum frisingense]
MLVPIGNNAHIGQAASFNVLGKLNGFNTTGKNLALKLGAENTVAADRKRRLDNVTAKQKVDDLMRLEPLWRAELLGVVSVHPLEHRSRDIASVGHLDMRNTVDRHHFPHVFVGRAS